ncbi:MAG: BMP family protein [Actinobacteria bacterium]|nr:BMP family protein [Actinomycetota bacterium]
MGERISKTGPIWAFVALIVLGLGLLAVGCGDGETTTTAAPDTTTTAAPDTTTTTAAAPEKEVTKIGVVVPEEGSDYGWNQEGVESAQALADELGVGIEVADGAGYEDPGPVLRQLVDNGADFLFAHASGYATQAMQVAEETKVPVVVIGAFEGGLVPGLSQDLETHAEEGSYLAGYLAAKMTKTKTLGIVISADDENWTKMAGGFVAGARSAMPDAKVIMAQIGQAGYADAAGGKRVTEAVIAGGADVVYGMGDGSSFGMIQAAETAKPPAGADKVWFIDVIGDKTSLDKKGVYLTSVWWDYLPLFKQAVQAYKDGTFGTEVFYMSVANDSIKLIKTDHIPDEVWAELEKIKADIISGAVEVPVLTDKAAVEALIKQ